MRYTVQTTITHNSLTLNKSSLYVNQKVYRYIVFYKYARFHTYLALIFMYFTTHHSSQI